MPIFKDESIICSLTVGNSQRYFLDIFNDTNINLAFGEDTILLKDYRLYSKLVPVAKVLQGEFYCVNLTINKGEPWEHELEI